MQGGAKIEMFRVVIQKNRNVYVGEGHRGNKNMCGVNDFFLSAPLRISKVKSAALIFAMQSARPSDSIVLYRNDFFSHLI